jgi:N-acetyl-gamma-glutamyl-phosphate reductase
MERVRIGVMGASGYTGAELLRLLLGHPRADVRWLTADRNAGQPLGALFPHLAHAGFPDLQKLEAVDLVAVDIVFCCLPHGLTQAAVRLLPESVRVVDLSADFRLRDVDQYEATYGNPHEAPELQAKAVYGLSEHYTAAIAEARLVANPGCYTTAAELPLLPLLKAGLIEESGIIIDAKSGITGAGRAAKEANLFAEVSEGFHAYGIATHRHTPEIEQCLSDFATRPIRVTFTPHLVPMNRGILATIYARVSAGADVAALQAELEKAYRGAPFVKALPMRSLPATRHVRGSNLCLIAVHPSRIDGEVIILSVIDNLVKGASGQAIQNMNLMCGLPEDMGLRIAPVFP